MLTHTTCSVNTFQLETSNFFFFLLPLVCYPFHLRKPLDIPVLQSRMDFTAAIPPFSLHDPDSLQRDGDHQGPVDQLNSRCLTEIQTSFNNNCCLKYSECFLKSETALDANQENVLRTVVLLPYTMGNSASSWLTDCHGLLR